MRHLTRRELLILLAAISIAPAAYVGRAWKAKGELHGEGYAEPFRIAGNFYFVGTTSLSAFFITGPEGQVLLDAGYAATVPMIIASIAKLGFDVKDVKMLINSSPGPGQAGGFSAIQQACRVLPPAR